MSGLYNQWQNNQSPGQVYWGPTQQYVGQATNNPYRRQALLGARAAIRDWQNQANILYPNAIGDLYGLGNQAGDATGQALNVAFNPIFSQVEGEMQNSPYYGEGLNAAQSAANYGLGGASQAYGQSQLLNQLGTSLPGWAQGIADQTMTPAYQMQAEAAGLPNQYGGWASQIMAPASGMQQEAAMLPGWGMMQAATTEAPVGFLQNLAYQAPAQAAAYAGGALAPVNTLYGQIGTLQGQQSALSPLVGQAAGTFAPLTQAAQTILNAGYDPQNALFNRTQQQVLDQSNALNAMSGVANSPYGAGVTGQNLSNFDINWQNNLLNRMSTAAGAAQGLYGQALGGLGTAGSLAGQIGGLGTQIGGLGSTIGGLYGTAGNLMNQGYGAAANLSGQAGNLMSAGGAQYLNALAQQNTLNQGAASLFGQGANVYGQGLQLQNTLNQGAANLFGQGANIYNQGLNTASSLLGQSTNLAGAAGQLAQLGELPQQYYTQNLMQQLQPALLAAQAAQAGTSAFGNLVGAAGSAYGQAGNLLNNYVQGAQSVNAAPYNLYQAMQGNNLAAIGQGINLGNQQYQLPENLMGNAQAYMGLGQSASSIANQIAAQNYAEQQQSLGNIGSLIGFGSMGSGLFGGGGLLGTGLLAGGLGATGTAGDLGAFGSMADFTGGLAGGVGGGGALGSLFGGGGLLGLGLL